MKRRGFTLIELLVVVAIIALLIAILLPSLGRAKELSNRAYCQANAKGIMTSFNVYGNDNSDQYPSVLPLNNTTTASGVYILPGTGLIASAGTTSDTAIGEYYTNTPPKEVSHILANEWLLTLKNQVTAKQFVCKSDPFNNGTAQPNPSGSQFFLLDFNAGTTAAGSANDLTYSYSFAFPWTNSGSVGINGIWRSNTDSSLPIMSDMAPAQNSNAGGVTINEGAITAAGGAITNGPKAVNSINHQREGQTVAFGDAHAEFDRRPDVGSNGDNIFSTCGIGTGTSGPTAPFSGTGWLGGSADGTGTITNGALQNYSSTPFDVLMIPVCDISAGTRK